MHLKTVLITIIALLNCLGMVHAADTQWTLATDDTSLTISVTNNKLYLTDLKNPAQKWNWVPVASEVPLPGKYNWTFVDAVEDKTRGKMVTLHFTNTTPALELNSVWRALPGPGPVENEVSVTNKSDINVIFNQGMMAASVKLTSDMPLTVHRAFKTNVGIGKVQEDKLTANSRGNTDANWIPLLLIGAGTKHGAYLGYEWELGGFQWSVGTNPLQLTCNVMPITENVTRVPGSVFQIPSVYYGVYKGDFDDGSNSFKRWFWNHKITRSLYDNTNEPWVEMCMQEISEKGDGSAGVTGNTPQSLYDRLAAAGVECVKFDFWDGTGKCWYTNRDWQFHPEAWPNGFDYAAKAHKAGMKASLYMGGTYNDVDLSTIAGRDAELEAVLSRYDKGWFDMWRTDRYIAPKDPIPANYEGVTNFLYIQDNLIANRPGYRYENCCNGGKYKGFAICRRMTYCTMNDEPYNAVTTRTTYYSNSYAINPVQLKSDLGLHQTAYQMRTHMLGAILSLATDNTVYRQHIAMYKEKQRPILRGANVYHILPMPDGTNWDGMEYYNPDIKNGSVFLFKPSVYAPDNKLIRLKGLQPKNIYTLNFQDREELNCVRTGAQLMTNGVYITGMIGAQASEIIWISETPEAKTTPEPVVPKDEDGKLSLIPLRDDQQLSVELQQGLTYWADANQNVYIDEAGKVITWKDARDKADDDDYIRAKQWVNSSRPSVVTGGVEINNLRLVDFGKWQAGANGIWMPWEYANENKARLTPAMVFMAVSCSDGSGFLLGDLERCDFHPAGYDKPPAIWFWSGQTQGRSGSLYINGKKVDATITKVSPGIEVATIVVPPGATVSNFLKDRNYNVGGGRIGEVLIYNKALDDATRQKVEEYLMKKWLPAGG